MTRRMAQSRRLVPPCGGAPRSATLRSPAPVLLAALGLLLRTVPAVAREAAPSVPPPHQLYGELFEQVQEQQVFPDSKTFCDSVPKSAPQEILARYHDAHPQTPEALRAFVAQHFIVPGAGGAADHAAEPAAGLTLSAHIDALWDTLTRHPEDTPPFSSLLPLPKPFVVPGGRFREIYYWDSYFTMLGLLESGRRDLTEDMVRDFAHLLDSYGRIPNGNRNYYLSRSQPPFFFAMVGLLDAAHPERAFARYLPQLRREYAFWMEGAAEAPAGGAVRRVVALAPGALLNRYYDDSDLPRDESYREDLLLARSSGREPRQFFRDVRAAAESGWDFSSRWFGDGRTLTSIETTSLVPVDLNSLLYGLEEAIRRGCESGADQACAREFAAHAAARRAAMDRYLWDATLGAYLDYNFARRERVQRLSAATLYPLFTHAASAAQAAGVARNTRARLLKGGGIVTTTTTTGQQWDAPNGWAPLQWIAVDGFGHYPQHALAAEIACRWTVNVARNYRASSKLVEKYDVVNTERAGGGGEYPLQDGFGWTNGVTRKLLALYPAAAELHSLEQCQRPKTAAHAAH